jgi:hypothetical protein
VHSLLLHLLLLIFVFFVDAATTHYVSIEQPAHPRKLVPLVFCRPEFEHRKYCTRVNVTSTLCAAVTQSVVAVDTVSA